MIITGILTLFYYLIAGLLFLIPTGGVFPAQISSALAVFIEQAVKWNNFFPVSTLFITLGLVFAIEIGRAHV